MRGSRWGRCARESRHRGRATGRKTPRYDEAPYLLLIVIADSPGQVRNKRRDRLVPVPSRGGALVGPLPPFLELFEQISEDDGPLFGRERDSHEPFGQTRRCRRHARLFREPRAKPAHIRCRNSRESCKRAAAGGRQAEVSLGAPAAALESGRTSWRSRSPCVRDDRAPCTVRQSRRVCARATQFRDESSRHTRRRRDAPQPRGPRARTRRGRHVSPYVPQRGRYSRHAGSAATWAVGQ